MLDMTVLVNNDCTVKNVEKCEKKTNDIKLICEKGDLYINSRPSCCETVFFAILDDYPLENLIGKKITSYSIRYKDKFYDELYDKYNDYSDCKDDYDVMKLKLENSKSFYIGYCVFSNGYYSGWINFNFKN